MRKKTIVGITLSGVMLTSVISGVGVHSTKIFADTAEPDHGIEQGWRPKVFADAIARSYGFTIDWDARDEKAPNVNPEIIGGITAGSKVVTGIAAPGATVDFYADEKITVGADQDGRWTVNLKNAVIGGGTYYAWATVNGNDWKKSANVKAITPINPAITALAGAIHMHSKSISGVASVGSKVEVWTNKQDGSEPKKLATVRADGKGNWTANLTDNLVNGNYVQAYVPKQPGNEIVDGWSEKVNIFGSKPVITTSALAIDSKSISGVAGAGATVEIWTNKQDRSEPKKLVTVKADGKGNWTANLTDNLTEGNYVQAYGVGNDWGDEMINVTDPNTKPIITDGLVPGSKVVRGTASPGATLDFYADEKITVIADKDGKWAASLKKAIVAGTAYYAWATVNGKNWKRSDDVKYVYPKTTVTEISAKKAQGTACPGATIKIYPVFGRYVVGTFYGFGTNGGGAFVGEPIATVQADSSGHWTGYFSQNFSLNDPDIVEVQTVVSGVSLPNVRKGYSSHQSDESSSSVSFDLKGDVDWPNGFSWVEN